MAPVRPIHTPQGDGENVFILSVDSPAVLTLSPGSWLQLTRWLRMAWFADEREQVGRQHGA